MNEPVKPTTCECGKIAVYWYGSKTYHCMNLACPNSRGVI